MSFLEMLQKVENIVKTVDNALGKVQTILPMVKPFLPASAQGVIDTVEEVEPQVASFIEEAIEGAESLLGASPETKTSN